MFALIRSIMMYRSASSPSDLGRSNCIFSTETFFSEVSYPWAKMASLENTKSLYHTIEVIDTQRDDHGKCLLLNNEVQFCSAEDAEYHELLVHFGVQYLPGATPKRVVIIGGGDCMVLREILKYRGVEKVYVLELDEMVTRVCEKHFGVNAHRGDNRVVWMYGKIVDSLKKLLDGDIAPDSKPQFDYIIVDTTETTPHNSEIDNLAFYDSLLGLMNMSTVLVKNGDMCTSFLRKIFANTLTYGYDSKMHVKRCSFTLAGVTNFRETTISTDVWYGHGIATQVYTPDKHYKYVPWIETYRQNPLDSEPVFPNKSISKSVTNKDIHPQYDFPKEIMRYERSSTQMDEAHTNTNTTTQDGTIVVVTDRVLERSRSASS